MNTETCTTATESLFSNGNVEHHNLIVAEAMEKTLEDEKCEPEIALAWAVIVKNALQNHSRHSPNDLVFRFNINTPSVLTDQLPTLEAATTSDIVRVNLNAWHAARKIFMKAESSKKLWKASRSNERTYADEGFVTGSTIEDKAAKDGVVLLKYWVRNVNVYWSDMEMHPCHLMKRNEENRSFGGRRWRTT